MKTSIKAYIFLAIIFACSCRIIRRNMVESSPDSRENCPLSTFHYFFKDKDRYVVSDYELQTSDGYILTVFRVKLSQKAYQELDEKHKKNVGRPVILAPGLASDADVMFYNGESKSIGFFLVNLGFDVWVMNNRGTKYSRKHVNPKITEKEYYNFSWQEMGLIDQPTLYKKIQKTYTQEKKIENVKILYFGHSQGAGQFFAGLSDPSTSDFLNMSTEKFFAIAPAVFKDVDEQPSPDFYKWHQIYNGGCSTYDAKQRLRQKECNQDPKKCAKTLKEHHSSINPKTDNYLEYQAQWREHTPSSTSSKDFVHLQQIAKGDPSKKNPTEPFFGHFDYGNESENMSHYKQKYPPAFDLSKITTKITIIYFSNDTVIKPKMIDLLQSKLTGCDHEAHEIQDWTHATP